MTAMESLPCSGRHSRRLVCRSTRGAHQITVDDLCIHMYTHDVAKVLDPTVVEGAGVALVGERGVQALSLRAVAGSLGVTPMALYRHVADSDALSEAVMDSIVRGSA